MRAKRIWPAIELRDLVREDVIARLDAMGEITAATLTVDQANVDVVRRTDPSLARALDPTADFAGRGVLDFTIRRRPHSRESLADRIRDAWRNLAQRDDVQETLRTLKVQGRNLATGELEMLDLLGQAIVTSRRILRTQPGSRVLVSEDAYAAISSAYDELHDEIARAPDIGVGS